MTTLKLKVLVEATELQNLKSSGFNLCLTRDVQYGKNELKGNVVFAMIPAEKLAPVMTLSWEEKYQVYETNTFEAGVKVDVGTTVADIQGGQQADFDVNGAHKVHGPSKAGEPFHVQNDWQNWARVGVNNYDAATKQFASIFISPKVPLTTLSSLLPIQNYGVFWHMSLETNTMFDVAKTPTYPFSLTKVSEITLEYKDASWVIPK
ncbi:hypothetical protein BYT27DRAFT_7245685 [Phlegmacium glaucopus]|nr:hypothetical protein BYT27DRAFT_7245678 [Phlegmacium glaucopus]KAF8800359.1 hypothetical protein BYT27DRAFT_7245685 [Phlegmacium glaucopus]